MAKTRLGLTALGFSVVAFICIFLAFITSSWLVTDHQIEESKEKFESLGKSSVSPIYINVPSIKRRKHIGRVWCINGHILRQNLLNSTICSSARRMRTINHFSKQRCEIYSKLSVITVGKRTLSFFQSIFPAIIIWLVSPKGNEIISLQVYGSFALNISKIRDIGTIQNSAIAGGFTKKNITLFTNFCCQV